MKQAQVLNLFGDLPASQVREVWDAAMPMDATTMRPGLWLGRNGGMPWPAKRFARHVVRRDYFAKLIVSTWGINVRVKQDGSHAALGSSLVPDGVRVDLPFRLTAAGLDYGFHMVGMDLDPLHVLQIRDFVRAINYATFSEVVSLGQLRRVGAWRGEQCDEGQLVVGYIAPMGIELIMGTPFGMVWHREASRAEMSSAEAYVRKVRMWDSSAGAASKSS